MERRRLGQTDMEVSVLGFGGAEIGYARVAPATVGRLLGSALDAGLNAIDTAECYAGSEALIGRAVGRRRAEYYLFTKCGHAAEDGRADWRPRSLVESIERSLRRLRTDYVDLIQLHSCSGPASGDTRATSATAETARRRATRSSAGASTLSRPRSASRIKRRST